MVLYVVMHFMCTFIMIMQLWHSTNFTHKGQFICHEEHYSACEEKAVKMSFVALGENNPVDVIRVVMA